MIGSRYLLELSEAETAAALDIRPGTVKSRLSRSLERLRAELGDHDELGRPDAIYFGDRSVSLVYGARPGFARSTTTGATLLVQQFRARVGPFTLLVERAGGLLIRVEGDIARDRAVAIARSLRPEA